MFMTITQVRIMNDVSSRRGSTILYKTILDGLPLPVRSTTQVRWLDTVIMVKWKLQYLRAMANHTFTLLMKMNAHHLTWNPNGS